MRHGARGESRRSLSFRATGHECGPPEQADSGDRQPNSGAGNQAIEIAEASAGIVMRRLGLILAARLAGIAMLHPLRSG
jgi:hypothetical protein